MDSLTRGPFPQEQMINPLWSPVSNGVASKIMRSALGPGDSYTFAPTRGGRFNTCYEVLGQKTGEKSLLRIGPTPTAVIYQHELAQLRREESLLSSGVLDDFAAPRILYADFTRTLVDRDVVVESFIPGVNGALLIQSASEHQAQLWQYLTGLAEELGQIEEAGGSFGFPCPSRPFSLWSLFVQSLAEMLLADLRRFKLLHEICEKIPPLLSLATVQLDHISSPRLAHGDLWPKNILVDLISPHRPSGILDWERSFWGDPEGAWFESNRPIGGRTVAPGFVYRLSMLSADFTEVRGDPRRSPKSQGSEIRETIYYIIFLLMRRLESQRYPRSEPWVISELVYAVEHLWSIT